MTCTAIQRDQLARRRDKLRRSTTCYGLDFVEVFRGANPARVRVHFLGPSQLWSKLDDAELSLCHVASGSRLQVQACPSTSEDTLELEINGPINPGSHRLSIDARPPRPQPDACFAEVIFDFRSRLVSAGDCRANTPASMPSADTDVDYLAKDYDSIRRMLLARLSQTIPEWRDRDAADLGMMLVELMAYEADYLSYFQDAVGAEAYLHTCRLRSSLRRHARLVDYRIHEGNNARTWVCVETDRDITWPDLSEVFFVAFRCTPPTGDRVTPADLAHYDQLAYEVFEPVASGPLKLKRPHGVMEPYDWQGARPCLPRGATSAVLLDPAGAEGPSLELQAGEIVVLEEVLGPLSGQAADADPAHRHAVRITSAPRRFRDELADVSLLEITWAVDDALPFELWIRPQVQLPSFCVTGAPFATVARGNVILVDHGVRSQETVEILGGARDALSETPNNPTRHARANLSKRHLVHSAPLPGAAASASAMLRQNPHDALPQIVLRELDDDGDCRRELPATLLQVQSPPALLQHLANAAQRGGVRQSGAACRSQILRRIARALGDELSPATIVALGESPALCDAGAATLNGLWQPRGDLLGSGPLDRHFVVEMTSDRVAELRFGRGGLGMAPATERLIADLRSGNAASGNVAAGAITRLGFHRGDPVGNFRAHNPLPAVGGTAPQSFAQIRLHAPRASSERLVRAMVAEDYERLVLREFGPPVRRVRATDRWTGHEHELLVVIDTFEGHPPAARLLKSIRRWLRAYRRIGHRVRVLAARQVALKLEVSVTCSDLAHCDHVRRELDVLFSRAILADGRPAFFHPDRAPFAESLFTDQIVGAANGVGGVAHAEVTRLERLERPSDEALHRGFLKLADDEIARLDNDPARPQRGQLHLVLRGGR